MPDKKYPDPKVFMEFDEDDPRFQVKLLSIRVDALTKEKEDLEETTRNQERRIAAMERTFQRGAGIAIALPILGTIVGFLMAYGKVIFAPWINNR